MAFAGVPLSTWVPALKVTPLGNAPDSLNVGAGMPVVVTVNEPGIPTPNVVLLALVIVGAWVTTTPFVSVKVLVAFVEQVLSE